ncbi:NUDIX hydrolase [Cellulomonas soli]|uniref:NUDIX hydrolase n=1 Tax=Cellulomonas soli TaxID=931535 RepID=UPI001CB7861D|nr:NUDIX domain-containing protein [Cellulomonas soli]
MTPHADEGATGLPAAPSGVPSARRGGPPPAALQADGGGPVHGLSTEWRTGPDGMRFRAAARVILLDEQDRLLLIRGHDIDQPSRSWWFTVGGGIDEGESSRDAAVRELHEETGIRLSAEALQGPVFTRSAIFDFWAQECRQDEEMYLGRVHSADVGEFSREGWTQIEHDLLDELGWWTLDDLERLEQQTEVFPAGLAGLVRGLLPVWDGTTRHLGLGRD